MILTFVENRQIHIWFTSVYAGNYPVKVQKLESIKNLNWLSKNKFYPQELPGAIVSVGDSFILQAILQNICHYDPMTVFPTILILHQM